MRARSVPGVIPAIRGGSESVIGVFLTGAVGNSQEFATRRRRRSSGGRELVPRELVLDKTGHSRDSPFHTFGLVSSEFFGWGPRRYLRTPQSAAVGTRLPDDAGGGGTQRGDVRAGQTYSEGRPQTRWTPPSSGWGGAWDVEISSG